MYVASRSLKRYNGTFPSTEPHVADRLPCLHIPDSHSDLLIESCQKQRSFYTLFSKQLSSQSNVAAIHCSNIYDGYSFECVEVSFSCMSLCIWDMTARPLESLFQILMPVYLEIRRVAHSRLEHNNTMYSSTTIYTSYCLRRNTQCPSFG